MKIGVTIFILFISFMIIGCFGGIYLYHRSATAGAEQVLMNQANYYFEAIAKSRANHIESLLEGQKEKIEMMADMDFPEKSIEKTTLKFSEQDLREIAEELREILEINEDDFKEIFILNKEEIVVASTKLEHIGKDESGHVEFLENKTGVHIGKIHYSEILKELVIEASAKMIDDETGNFIGVIVAAFSLDDLSEIALDRTGLGKTGEIYLINNDGYMITPSRFLLEEETFLKKKVDTVNSRNCFGIVEHPEEHIGHEAVAVSEDYRGEKVLGTHVYIPEMEWCLLAEIDEEEALCQIRDELRKSTLVSLIVIFIVMVFFIFLADYFILRIIKHSSR